MKQITAKQRNTIWTVGIGMGILLRFIVMSLGHNYDFQSYLIVGDMVRNGIDVYANTERYNYGPIFMYIQGALYSISTHALEPAWMYRVLMVSFLTTADLGITLWLRNRYGRKIALFFLLNPVSIIITGYHNQFDNVAILLMLIATSFYNEEKKFAWKDFGFVIFMSLSLTMKHIFFIFPVWLLLSKTLPWAKKMIYACVPPLLFLLSFVPYMLRGPESANGILEHVFLYRSLNNSPLLGWLYGIVGVPDILKTLLFIVLVCAMGWIFRNRDIEYRTLMYLMCLVTFASAVTNQYLAIPMAAICVFGRRMKYVYMILMGHYLLWNKAGMDIISVYPYEVRLPNSEMLGYFVACFLILCMIFWEIYDYKKHCAVNCNGSV